MIKINDNRDDPFCHTNICCGDDYLKSYDKVVNILKNRGLDQNAVNISDYWFDNHEILQDDVNIGLYGAFGLQVRWKSELGQACNNAVKKYIQSKIDNRKEQLNQLWKYESDSMALKWPEVVINFQDFFFIWNGKKYTLTEFISSFKTGWTDDWADLSGIDLSGIQLSDCTFENCYMPHTNFDNSNIFQVTFKNCVLNYSSFVNSKVIKIFFDDKTNLYGCDFSNAFISALTIKDAFIFTEVSYWYLIKYAIKKLFNMKNIRFSNSDNNHTVFLSNNTTMLMNPEQRKLKYYIDWYQYVVARIENIHDLKISDKITFITSLLFTKNWTSYSVLSIFVGIVNLLYATAYYIFYKDFKNLDHDFVSAIYYSVVTFTTLGYGDIYPFSSLAKIFVITEVFVGYVILGIFVFLLGDKVNKRY